MGTVEIGEKVREVKNQILNYIEEEHKIFGSIFDEYNSIIKKNTYEPLYNMALGFETGYNKVLNDLKTNVKHLASGDGGVYVHFAKDLHMGEDAIAEVRKEQEELADKVCSLSEIKIISDTKHDFANSSFDTDSIVNSLNQQSGLFDKVTSLCATADADIKAKAINNEATKAMYLIFQLFCLGTETYSKNVLNSTLVLVEKMGRSFANAENNIQSKFNDAEKVITNISDNAYEDLMKKTNTLWE